MTAAPLRPVEPQPVESVVALLRDMLARAETGEITDCIIISVNVAEANLGWSENAWEHLARIGALEWAKMHMMMETAR